MIGYNRKFKGSRPRDEWEWEEWVFFLLAATRPEVTCAGCTERWNSKEDRGSAGRNGIVARAEYYGGEKGGQTCGQWRSWRGWRTTNRCRCCWLANAIDL